jgi:hypothetical protein
MSGLSYARRRRRGEESVHLCAAEARSRGRKEGLGWVGKRGPHVLAVDKKGNERAGRHQEERGEQKGRLRL